MRRLLSFAALCAAGALAAATAGAGGGDLSDLSGVSAAFGSAAGAVQDSARALADRRPAESADETVERLRRMRSFDPASAPDEEVVLTLRAFGHTLERHGPDVTEDYLRSRGKAAATKFSTARDMTDSARRCWLAAEARVSSDPGFRKQLLDTMSGRLNGVSVRFDMGRPVGWGLRRTPGGFERIEDVRLVTAVIRRTGERLTLLTIYPQAR